MVTKLDELLRKKEKSEASLTNIANGIQTLTEQESQVAAEDNSLTKEILEETISTYKGLIDTEEKDIEQFTKERNEKIKRYKIIISAAESGDILKVKGLHKQYSGIVKPLICLTLEPYQNRKISTQDGFLKDNVDMSTLAGYFLSMQQANKLKNSSNKEEREIGEAYLKSLNQDIRKWAMTGDRIRNEEFPNITYIQKYGTQTAKETNITITQEGWTTLKKFLNQSEDNYNAAKIILGTDTSKNDIIGEFREFTGLKEDNLNIGFSDKERRIQVKESPVLLFSLDYFSILCFNLLDINGCARGGA